ncbi:hypothetical protein UFOVP756_11 [uncultured Caudovirales phage]|uniref:Uncharacterized protein n=1 Tax=uncultured Caudovirales phage TaxID=2100421 RepID=A0A6J7XDA4_9CAUD|nr:hypothetical protein UFOVP756_11 [uncultured Caudovirales phage]
MNWIALNPQPKSEISIYTNGTQLGNDLVFFKKSKSFIRLVKNDNNTYSELSINGQDYSIAGVSGSEIYIEISDIINATDDSSTIVFQWDGDVIFELDYMVEKGLKQSVVVSDVFPSEIPIVEGSLLPFYMQAMLQFEWLKTDSSWAVLGVNDFGSTYNLMPRIQTGDYTNILRTINTTFDDTFDLTFQANDDEQRYFELKPLECEQDIILVEWVSRFGQRKSWWFEVEKTVNESHKQLDLETMEDGFNTLKSKQISILVQTKHCDIFNQTYLSDLVFSDEVYIYDGETTATKRQVKVSQNTIDVENKRKTVALLLNTYRYDSI